MGSSGQRRRKKRASDVEVDEYAPLRARRARLWLAVQAPVLLGTIGFVGLAGRNSTLRDNPLTWTSNL